MRKGRSRLKDRIVFQVRGLLETDGILTSTILTHIGRATTPEQQEAGGKWLTYKGFRKSAELYNLDRLLLDPVARDQTRKTGHVLVVEGPFDVAKLVEAGVFNVVAVMGSDLSDEAKPKLGLMSRKLNNPKLRFWFDRDKAGESGQITAQEKLAAWDIPVEEFDWNICFGTNQIAIPEDIQDPCDMSVAQIKWLRQKGLI
ncbi:MAG: toprim domain-containing protein [Rhodobacteraceae bacterium]|nr:toprim domain-containing protein [Paracoccaceae bacterium]